MQLIGIVLLYLVGLSGSVDILGKKRALTALKIRQQGGRCKVGGMNLVTRNSNSLRLSSNCGLHPLIHTLLDFTVAQDLEGCQRFAIFGSKLPQTGHMLSFGLTITVSLHLGHLEGLFKFCFSVFSKSGLLYVFDVCFLIFPQSVQPGSR